MAPLLLLAAAAGAGAADAATAAAAPAGITAALATVTAAAAPGRARGLLPTQRAGEVPSFQYGTSRPSVQKLKIKRRDLASKSNIQVSTQ